MRNRTQRQATLLKLVRQRAIRSQAELVRALQKKGFKSTQASVSRDLRDLSLVKSNGRYVAADRLSGPPARRPDPGPASELITGADPVGANLVVVRTAVGAANAVAVDLDRRQIPGLVGTIAGDDTIFLAVRSRTAQGRTVALLKQWIRPQA